MESRSRRGAVTCTATCENDQSCYVALILFVRLQLVPSTVSAIAATISVSAVTTPVTVVVSCIAFPNTVQFNPDTNNLIKFAQNDSITNALRGTVAYIAPEILLSTSYEAYTKKIEMLGLDVVVFTW
uniref:Uncharacterized protein n=1 Tax=Glossina austeni TaxID=7395 RepID=A0A1A9UMF0_GLOAU